MRGHKAFCFKAAFKIMLLLNIAVTVTSDVPHLRSNRLSASSAINLHESHLQSQGQNQVQSRYQNQNQVTTPTSSSHLVNIDSVSVVDGSSKMESLITVDKLKAIYGHRESFWGDWSCQQTRKFYKEQLPAILRMDEIRRASGVTLEERAKSAAHDRIALRLYARERCVFSGRIAAELYDGLRHLSEYGVWATQGMSWQQLKVKYFAEAREVLGSSVSNETVSKYAYTRIIDRSSITNSLIDSIADGSDVSRSRSRTFSAQQALFLLLRNLLKEQIIASIAKVKSRKPLPSDSPQADGASIAGADGKSSSSPGDFCDSDDDDCTVCFDLSPETDTDIKMLS